MKIDPKLVSKYGSKDEVVLPPAPEEGVEDLLPEIPVDTGAPVIEEPSEEESEKFFNIRFNPEDSPFLQKRIEHENNKKLLEETNMFSSPEGSHGDNPTLPGGKRNVENEHPTFNTSAKSKHDLLVSSCETYFRLASKLK